MHEARVLVVDDSAAMRALFCDILERTKNIRIVGTAVDADDARDQIAELKPNVVTLDVEMPGMSGLELLEEIMEGDKPLPVIMLSSIAQDGSETAAKAAALGAIACFPKPLKVSPEQFDKAVAKLGKIVMKAANCNIRDEMAKSKGSPSSGAFDWNGSVAVFSASTGGTEALSQVLADHPENCPPTLVTLQTEPALAEAFIKHLDGKLKCSVKAAEDGAALSQGTIYVAADLQKHVILEPGETPKIRLIERDPIEGARPSANLLFGTIARAGVAAVGTVLTGIGEDGAKGLKLMRDAGCKTFAQDRETAMVPEAPAAALAAGAVEQELPAKDLGSAVLACCSSK